MKTNTDSTTLHQVFNETRTRRIFSWVIVAWPNIKPLMLRFMKYLNNISNSETKQTFCNVIKVTSRSVTTLHPSIKIDENRRDRDYLIAFYRIFFTSAVRELSSLSLSTPTSKWEPLQENMGDWMTANDPPHTLVHRDVQRKSVSSREIKMISDSLLGDHDREILGEEIDFIYTPYPAKKEGLKHGQGK